MSAVLFEKINDHVVLVTLNRPDAHNAINGEIAQQLDALVKQIDQDPTIRVAIITGAGEKAFCAGADLKMISQGRSAELYTTDGGFGGFVFAQRKKPWIAAVNGFALAGGTEFCLACELIVASENAKFGLPEVKRGLIAGAGGVFRLAKALPEKIAMEVILSGNHFDAAFALQHGLVNKVVSADQLMTAAIELANSIASNSPNSVQTSMSFIKNMTGKSDRQLMDESTSVFLEIAKSADALEGTMAFVEKREPVWAAN